MLLCAVTIASIVIVPSIGAPSIHAIIIITCNYDYNIYSFPLLSFLLFFVLSDHELPPTILRLLLFLHHNCCLHDSPSQFQSHLYFYSKTFHFFINLFHQHIITESYFPPFIIIIFSRCHKRSIDILFYFYIIHESLSFHLLPLKFNSSLFLCLNLLVAVAIGAIFSFFNNTQLLDNLLLPLLILNLSNGFLVSFLFFLIK